MPRKKPTPFTVEPFTALDKSVHINGPVHIEVDNDDVDTVANKFLIDHLLAVLNHGWKDGAQAWVCQNEECEYAFRPTHGCFQREGVNDDPRCLTCEEIMPWETITT